ncbi:MAG: PTS transporter subunit EIIA [Lentisphaerae bacterium]|nr:PTS transporter subunit EIIA [Lentisphaerota bacterium]
MTDLWSPAIVRLNPAGENLLAVIDTLSDAAVAEGLLKAEQRDIAITAVLRREMSGSTVMPEGIAFPHGRTSAVSEQCVVLGVFTDGKGFSDKNCPVPVWLVVLVFAPLSTAGASHIQLLANLCRRLMGTGVVEQLRAATNSKDVLNVLRGS